MPGFAPPAARELHPRFVELVERTPEPFIQMIIDVAVPRMAFGRAGLLGVAGIVAVGIVSLAVAYWKTKGYA